MSVANVQADLGVRPYRAALRAALRTGDSLGAARAWERLRFAAHQLTYHERAAGRDARRAVGRAIRDARYRRMQSAMDAFKPAAADVVAEETSRRHRRLVPIAIGLIALSVIALLLVFMTTRPVDEDYAPAAAPPPETQAQPTPLPTIAVAGRGRTLQTPAPQPIVAAVVTPQPSAAPSASAAPTSGTAPVSGGSTGGQPGGVTGGTPGGVTGGVPGGVVGGVPGSTGTKTLPPATPTPYVLPARPPVLPPGSDRFQFLVLDQATGLPLAGVCVNYGFTVCGPQDPHTSSSGLYWLDLNPGMATAWNFKFFNDGYLTATVVKTYRPGMGTQTTTIFLRRS